MSDMKKILVIDDEPDIVYTISEICKFAGHEVVSANEGLKGVELLKGHKPNLVIVDYHMPKYDGLSTVKKIREIDDTVAIMVLTVDERQEILEKFMLVGATDFSLKPVKAPDLISRVNVNLQINSMQMKNKEQEQSVFVEKGISSATLQMIINYLEVQMEEQTIKEISKGVELAYQTVHRYIQYLIDNDQVELVSMYGKVGRPLNYYRLIK
jgi:two-component system response regulator DctR